jgi:hypothetical protein
MITVYLFISTRVTAAVRFNIRQDVLKHLVLSWRKLLKVIKHDLDKLVLWDRINCVLHVIMITHWSTRRKSPTCRKSPTNFYHIMLQDVLKHLVLSWRKLLKVINKLIYTIATFKMIFFSTSTTKIFSNVYIFVLIFGNTSSSFFCLFYCLFVFCVFFVFVFFVFVFILGWMPTIFTTFCVFLWGIEMVFPNKSLG